MGEGNPKCNPTATDRAAVMDDFAEQPTSPPENHEADEATTSTQLTSLSADLTGPIKDSSETLRA
jgi:hypothetical protein